MIILVEQKIKVVYSSTQWSRFDSRLKSGLQTSQLIKTNMKKRLKTKILFMKEEMYCMMAGIIDWKRKYFQTAYIGIYFYSVNCQLCFIFSMCKKQFEKILILGPTHQPFNLSSLHKPKYFLSDAISMSSI